jgi:hypothetical protein
LAKAGANPSRALPPVPTRDQLGHVTITFQGLVVRSEEWGEFRCHEGIHLAVGNAATRQAIYRAKRAKGDRHAMLNVSGAYFQPGPLPRIAWAKGRDFSEDWTSLYERAREIIAEGFHLILMCAGDGHSKPKVDGRGVFNDPLGWTYGHEWLMEQFRVIYRALEGSTIHFAEDLTPYTVFSPGYDGVIPAWQPAGRVDDFLEMARGVIGEGAKAKGLLFIELGSGHAQWGSESADSYHTVTGKHLDGIFQEFPSPMGPPRPPPPDFLVVDGRQHERRAPWDQVWQVAARTLGPRYRRPPEQPVQDDPDSPFGEQDHRFLLRGETPRGRRFNIALEYDTYLDVRGKATLDQIERHRRYLKSIGYEDVG